MGYLVPSLICSERGTGDIGVNYPRLNWEAAGGDFVCPDGVGVDDVRYLAELWLTGGCTADNNDCGGVDADRSGAVDLGDWAVLATHWLAE